MESLRHARNTLAKLRGPIGAAADRLDYRPRLVGGWVRDLLLAANGQISEANFLAADLDLVVEGDARELGKSLQEKWGGSLKLHDPFMTATWQFDWQALDLERSLPATGNPEVAIDLITARSEVYPKLGQLPLVKSGNFGQDTARRDITINTFSLDLREWPDFNSSQVSLKVSCWSGALRDLQEGRIRLLHANSLQDDPTRILRLFRYEQRFSFYIEAETAAWLREAMQENVLTTVAPERIKAGLEQIFAEKNVTKALRRLYDWGVLNALGLNPEADRFWKALERTARSPSPNREVYWVLLLGLGQSSNASGQRALPIFAAAVEKDIDAFRQLVNREWNDLRPSQVWMRLRETRLTVRQALRASLPDHESTLKLYDDDWQHVTSHLDGNDLLKIGYQRGPQIGHMLELLRCGVLDGELQSRKQELDRVQRVLGPPPKT